MPPSFRLVATSIMAASIVVVVFVIVAASVVASAYSNMVRSSPDLGGGWLLIVEVGGQPHSLSGNVTLGIPVRIHKRIMGALTRNNGNDKRSLFVVLIATSISVTWQWDDAAWTCCIVPLPCR